MNKDGYQPEEPATPPEPPHGGSDIEHPFQDSPQIAELKTEIKDLKQKLKLQEQDNERIIQSSKGAVDRMKAENSELKKLEAREIK